MAAEPMVAGGGFGHAASKEPKQSTMLLRQRLNGMAATMQAKLQYAEAVSAAPSVL